MPVGVIINSLSILVGGIIGSFAGDRIQADFKEKMNMVFGACALTMGISSIVLMKNMPAVVMSVILGTIFGMLIHLEEKIHAGCAAMQRLLGRFVTSSGSGLPEEEFKAMFLVTVILFCASGTGIYGSIVSGMTGDHSILMAKSVLDFFTALIFACTLGAVVSVVAIPQFLLFFLLFLCSGLILPLCSETMIADFKACGGVIILATGFRMTKIRNFPVADMIPAMVLAMPLSWLWTTFVLPLVTR